MNPDAAEFERVGGRLFGRPSNPYGWKKAFAQATDTDYRTLIRWSQHGPPLAVLKLMQMVEELRFAGENVEEI